MQFDRLQNAGAHASELDFSKAVSVASSERLDFSKDNPGVTNLRIELYWDSEDDGDVSALLLGADGNRLPGVTRQEAQNPTGKDKLTGATIVDVNKTRGMIWYNNLTVDGMQHTGDALSSNDDPSMPEETMLIKLDYIEREAEALLLVASTYPNKRTPDRAVPFGKLRNCKVLVINDDTKEVIYVYELDEDYSTATSVELAKFYKRDGEWKYVSMGAAVGTSAMALEDIVNKY